MICRPAALLVLLALQARRRFGDRGQASGLDVAAALRAAPVRRAQYLTRDKEANEVEDRLGVMWRALAAGRLDGLADRLDAIERHLRTLTLPYGEWEVLFRQTLMVERALLRKPASAFLKTPAFGQARRRDAGGRGRQRQAGADTVREMRELAAPPPPAARSRPDRLLEQLQRLVGHGRARTPKRLVRFLRRAA